jgi:hypothetical protein
LPPFDRKHPLSRTLRDPQAAPKSCPSRSFVGAAPASGNSDAQAALARLLVGKFPKSGSDPTPAPSGS